MGKIRDFRVGKEQELLEACVMVQDKEDINHLSSSLGKLHLELIKDKDLLERNVRDIFAKVRAIEINTANNFNRKRWDLEYHSAYLTSFGDLIIAETDEPIEADALAAAASQRYVEFLRGECRYPDGTYNREYIESLLHSSPQAASVSSSGRCDALASLLEDMVREEDDENLEWFLSAGVTQQDLGQSQHNYVPTNMFLAVMDRLGLRGQELANENYDLLLQGTTILNEGGNLDELTGDQWQQFHFMNRVMQTHGIMADYVGAMSSYDRIYNKRYMPDGPPTIDIQFTENETSGKRFVNLVLYKPLPESPGDQYSWVPRAPNPQQASPLYTATAHPWDRDMKAEISGDFADHSFRLRSELSSDIIDEVKSSHDSVLGMCVNGYGENLVGFVPVLGDGVSIAKTTYDIGMQANQQDVQLNNVEGYLSDFEKESASHDQGFIDFVLHHDAYGSGGVRVSNHTPDNPIDLRNTYTLIYDPIETDEHLGLYNDAREAKGLDRVESINQVMIDPQMNTDFMRYIDGLAASEKG